MPQSEARWTVSSAPCCLPTNEVGQSEDLLLAGRFPERRFGSDPPDSGKPLVVTRTRDAAAGRRRWDATAHPAERRGESRCRGRWTGGGKVVLQEAGVRSDLQPPAGGGIGVATSAARSSAPASGPRLARPCATGRQTKRSEGKRRIYSDLRRRSQTKNTPPIRPVTMPMGMSSGAITVRAAMSVHRSRIAPIIALAGRTRA